MISQSINFVVSKLIKNEIGAMYEEDIINRWLTLELPNGNLLEVFDLDVISDNLVMGKFYEFVLCPLTFNSKYANTRETYSIKRIIPEWFCSSDEQFLATIEKLCETSSNYSIVEFDIGGVLLTKDLYDVFEGDDKRLKVVCGRFDLYGVKEIAK